MKHKWIQLGSLEQWKLWATSMHNLGIVILAGACIPPLVDSSPRPEWPIIASGSVFSACCLCFQDPSC